jgi:Tol biopolymer transport system component
MTLSMLPALFRARRFSGCLLAAAALGLAGVALAQQGAPAGAEKVYSRAGHRWFEDLALKTVISSDGKWALLARAGGVDLISLVTRKEDAARLRGPLASVSQAFFCGNELLRMGQHGALEGWYATIENKGLDRVMFKPDAIPVCSTDGKTSAYFRSNVADAGLWVGGWKERKHIAVPGVITGAVFAPDAESLYAMVRQADGSTSLVQMPVGMGKAVPLAQGLDADPGRSPLSLSPDGGRLYLSLVGEKAPDAAARQNPDAERWLDIYEFALATKRLKRLVHSAGDKTAPVEATGNLYWSQNTIHDSVVALPVAGGPVHEVLPGAELPTWSRDSRQIAFFFGQWRRADWALDLDAGTLSVDGEAHATSPRTVLIAGNHEDFPPEWSPDGKWIAFHSHRAPQPVAYYDAPGASDDIWLKRAGDPAAPEMRLTDFGWETGSPSWSPDGRRLVFPSWEKGGKPGVYRLWISTINPETGSVLGSVKLPLPAEMHSAEWPVWAPKGEEIAVEDESAPGERTIWILAADGSKAQRVVTYKCDTYGGLDWTPDAQTILYSALQDGRMQLFAIPRAGGTPRKLSADAADLLHPRVSPDGRWIAATRLETRQEIWRKKL